MSAAPLFEPGAGAGTVDAVLQARELEALAHDCESCRCCSLADAPGRMRLGDTHQRDGIRSAPVQLRETRGLVEQETGTERNAVHRMPVVVAVPRCAGEDACLYRLTP